MSVTGDQDLFLISSASILEAHKVSCHDSILMRSVCLRKNLILDCTDLRVTSLFQKLREISTNSFQFFHNGISQGLTRKSILSTSASGRSNSNRSFIVIIMIVVCNKRRCTYRHTKKSHENYEYPNLWYKEGENQGIRTHKKIPNLENFKFREWNSIRSIPKYRNIILVSLS